MSFILDALKKAESERNRGAGPVLMSVRIAPPRRRLPAWAWALGCVLLANLAVLAWLLLRAPQAATAAAAPATSPVAAPVYATPPPTLPSTRVAPPPTTIAAPIAAPIAAARPAAPPDLATLPSLQDVVAAGVNLPTLVMNMHVYDPTPAQRYVLLNGMRLTEGDFTADGIKLEAITERGAVLDARGHRFLLAAGGG